MNGLRNRIKALEEAVGGFLARDRWHKFGRALSRGMVHFGGAGIASGPVAEFTEDDGREIERQSPRFRSTAGGMIRNSG